MKEKSMIQFSFPAKEGGFWKSEEARPILEGINLYTLDSIEEIHLVCRLMGRF